MSNPAANYDLLAGLFQYPSATYPGDVDQCRRALAAAHPAAAEALSAFVGLTAALSVAEFEELFTRTFDHDPACALEVGWHLFGENYDRGTFLVWMRAQLRHFGLPESTELPDHLTHVLAVLGRLDRDGAARFAADCVLPALERLRAGLNGKSSPYLHAVSAVVQVLQARHGSIRRDGVPLPLCPPQPGDSPLDAQGVCR